MTATAQILRAAGINLRGSVGNLTGISRDIASASEESILGLAAGINTQNYYMSVINQNVAAILAKLGGEVTPSPSIAPSSVEGGEEGETQWLSVQELVNTHLPNIDQNIADIKTMLSRVITNGTDKGWRVMTKV